MPFQLQAPIDARKPFESAGNGKYACFNFLAGRNGVYVFVKNDGERLYVGRSYAELGRLNKRLEQYYNPGDTGVTFPQNYCEEKGCGFEGFKELLESSKIHTFVVDRGEEKDSIIALEYALICQLKPKYNREIQRVRTIGIEYICGQVKRMRDQIDSQHLADRR